MGCAVRDSGGCNAVDAAMLLLKNGGGGVTPGQLEEALAVKADKVAGAVAGNLAALDGNGNLVDSGIALSIVDGGVYNGVDLTLKFATEIAASPYSGDPWAWISGRIQAGDFSGIRVQDYIPFITTNNITLNAEIAGINTYKGYGDTAKDDHIDFICRELWPEKHPINPVNFNNGTKFGTADAVECPWLASDLYFYLNSGSGTVASEAAAGGGSGTAVDYSTTGVYDKLPAALKAVITEKRLYLSSRYSGSGLLNDDNGAGWKSIGKLWLPTECEVYGCPCWGGRGGNAVSGTAVQYPLFSGSMKRVKKCADVRNIWWLGTAYSGNSTYWCSVSTSGYGAYNAANNANAAAPVCFRIS